MSGLDKDRFRNKTVSFRMSPDERRLLTARLKVSGKPKGQFIIDSILKSKIDIIVGKYQSDRLSLEIKRLREQITEWVTKEDFVEVRESLLDCNALIEELLQVMKKD
jgi:uncharacterized protein (DUF1778 family)